MKKFTRLIILTSAFGAPGLFAQQAVASSGGEASGSGGNASYTVGQVVYTAISGSGGTATQGVQQPYEFFVLGKDDFPGISLSATVYPNPAVSFVRLRIDSMGSRDLNYELSDLNGRVLETGRIQGVETDIQMEQLPQATYVLRVLEGQSGLKSFKILKNTK